jgi:hypothetical protein
VVVVVLLPSKNTTREGRIEREREREREREQFTLKILVIC